MRTPSQPCGEKRVPKRIRQFYFSMHAGSSDQADSSFHGMYGITGSLGAFGSDCTRICRPVKSPQVAVQSNHIKAHIIWKSPIKVILCKII